MEDLQLFEEIIRLQKERQPAVLAVVVESSGSVPRKTGAKMVVCRDGTAFGTVGGGRIEAETVQAAHAALEEGTPRTVAFTLTEAHGHVCGGRVLVYLEPLNLPPRLLAIGAGHVNQTLSRSAREAGFEVVLADPSAEKAAVTHEAFVAADLCCPLAELFNRVAVDVQTSVVIATRSHEEDFRAVRAALATDAGFIGMVGSRRKKEAMRAYLREEGIAEERIDRVVIPVGLAICAQTPEEIGISIVAQLIFTRRGRDGADIGARSGCGTVAANGRHKAVAAAR